MGKLLRGKEIGWWEGCHRVGLAQFGGAGVGEEEWGGAGKLGRLRGGWRVLGSRVREPVFGKASCRYVFPWWAFLVSNRIVAVRHRAA